MIVAILVDAEPRPDAEYMQTQKGRSGERRKGPHMISIYCNNDHQCDIDRDTITISELYEIAKQQGKEHYHIACFFHRETEDVDSIDFDEKTHTVHI